MVPFRSADPYDWPALLAVIPRAFAGMEGRIDPPSSLHRLTAEGLARQAADGEVGVIGSKPAEACMVLTPKTGRLYPGKLRAFRPRLLSGPEVMVAHSREAFDADGRLKDPHTVKGLEELIGLLRAEALR